MHKSSAAFQWQHQFNCLNAGLPGPADRDAGAGEVCVSRAVLPPAHPPRHCRGRVHRQPRHRLHPPDASYTGNQLPLCCGSVIFLDGTGSADPCLWPMDPDPDPVYFRPWPLRRQQKTIFFCLLPGTFWRYGHYIIFLRWKVPKKSQYSKNQGFSYYFCLMIEGSGSVPLTNGSGSRRPKDIRIRIWIPNIVSYVASALPCLSSSCLNRGWARKVYYMGTL